MGSKTFDGVWFLSFAHDHEPPHVHGRYGETEVIINVFSDGTILLSARRDAISPQNAKRSDIAKILRVAAAHGPELWRLWEAMHGN